MKLYADLKEKRELWSNKAELVGGIKAIDNKGRDYIDCRIYMNRGNTFICDLWLMVNGGFCVNSGKASGSGYDKQSACIDSAVSKFMQEYKRFGGVGEYATLEFFKEFMKTYHKGVKYNFVEFHR